MDKNSRIDDIIHRIELALSCGAELKDIHDRIVVGDVSEEEFFLCYHAAHSIVEHTNKIS